MNALLALLLIASPALAAKPATRCGWIDNETPGNYTLADREAEWVISVQGGHQAEGDVADAPNDQEMVYSNGEHGYWCGCITATVDAKEKTVLKILSSKGEKLSTCIRDKGLHKDFVPSRLVHPKDNEPTQCQDQAELKLSFRDRQACVNKRGDYYFLIAD